MAVGKCLHLLVAIAYNRGVVYVEEYTKMNGVYFSDFVSQKFPALVSWTGTHKNVCNG